LLPVRADLVARIVPLLCLHKYDDRSRQTCSRYSLRWNTDPAGKVPRIPIGPEREIEGNRLEEGINHFGFEVESVEALVPVCK